MKAEILAIGTELLLGDIVNTNAQYLSRRLADIGLSVYYQGVVGDNEIRLLEALKLSFERSDVVITTGGLGPTTDDITKETGAKFFNKNLVLHTESLNKIEDFFNKLNKPMTESNVKQAYFPEGCTILTNNNGTAPGCIINENNKILVVLPGPPREMKPMFEESVLPYIEKYTNCVLVSKILRTYGLGESAMAEMVEHIIKNNTNPTIAPYAKQGEAILRITAKASNKTEANNLILPVENEIRNILGDYIYGEGETNLQSVIGELLVKNKLTISTAESCTGGLLASTLIDYPGVSEIFMEGAVTYSNESKMKRLGVKEETLDKYGAVSKETAKEMAEGIAKTTNTNIGLSTTGIAGPSGGTANKPVGLVYIGLSINGATQVKELRLQGDRQTIRKRTVMEILNCLRKELLTLNN